MKVRAQKQNQSRQKASSNIKESSTKQPAESHILSLQRTIGNQVVQRLLRAYCEGLEEGPARPTSTSFARDFSRRPLHANGRAALQPKLKIGTPGDRYEQEADRAAEQVTRVPQRTEGSSEQSEQGVGSSRTVDETAQRKPAAGESVTASPENEAQNHSRRSNQSLSSQERAFFEPRFGHDFSQVRLHDDTRSADMANALNADAFTVGRDIYFGPGKLQPRTTESKRLLAHELAHVVQQSHTGQTLQPKLKITGKADHVSRAIALLNAGLGNFYYVSVDKSGEVKMEPIRAAHTSSKTGPNAQQKALADRLWTVVNDPKDVNMTVSAGSTTSGGSYTTGDFDIADLEVYGVAGLIHEIVEQHLKQTKGMAYGTETTGAHGEATIAESEVRGAIRGKNKIISQTANADGTRDAVIETPYTYPDGTVKTMVRVIKSNNFISMTWK